MAALLERCGRELWEAGVRDARPRQVKFEGEVARWQLGDGRLRLAPCSGMVELIGSAQLELPLVELVEVIQVLEALGNPVSPDGARPAKVGA